MKNVFVLSPVKRLWALMLIFVVTISFSQGQIFPRTDTLFIPAVSVSPVIDGAIDNLWETVQWNQVDQIWMPYNNEQVNVKDGLFLWSGANDFTGKFKVVWSQKTNLLYFLVEVTDDVFVDGYSYNSNPSAGGGYPNYDIVEVFIDEDRSGGLHVFDGTGAVGTEWGKNAENAFSYHIATNALADGEIQRKMHALDIAGSSWSSYSVADFAGHFPEFAMVKKGNVYTYEFSLNVHNDIYSNSNPAASVVTLGAGKILGLSMAYCDNDNPGENPLRRDHFFGSVDVPFHAHNDHWKNADWFGVAKLTDEVTGSGQRMINEPRFKVFTADRQLVAEISSSYAGPVQLRVINILGAEQFRYSIRKEDYTAGIREDISGLPKGIYIVEIIQGNYRYAEKISVR
jgi:hypothetical protein